MKEHVYLHHLWTTGIPSRCKQAASQHLWQLNLSSWHSLTNIHPQVCSFYHGDMNGATRFHSMWFEIRNSLFSFSLSSSSSLKQQNSEQRKEINKTAYKENDFIISINFSLLFSSLQKLSARKVHEWDYEYHFQM